MKTVNDFVCVRMTDAPEMIIPANMIREINGPHEGRGARLYLHSHKGDAGINIADDVYTELRSVLTGRYGDNKACAGRTLSEAFGLQEDELAHSLVGHMKLASAITDERRPADPEPAIDQLPPPRLIVRREESK